MTCLHAKLSSVTRSVTGFPLELEHPFAFAAKTHDADNPTYEGAMKGEHKKQYKKAMTTELDGLVHKDTYIVKRRDAVPAGEQVINALWAFKLKRDPIGEIVKWKARLCARGDMQKVDELNDNYSPVINWTTVRLLFVMQIVFGWHGRQFDFVNAFCQATLDKPVYMRCPRGTTINDPSGKRLDNRDYVFELQKSLYGLREASKCWFLTLKDQLEAYGFKQSLFDPCLFFKKGIIFAVYVDDCICISQDSKGPDEVFKHLSAIFHMTDEGTIENFLGIRIRPFSRDSLVGTQTLRHEDEDLRSHSTLAGYRMSQPALIRKIIEAAGMDIKHDRSKPTPAVAPVLHKDETGPERSPDSFNYRRIIGMLIYLAQNTRPDITFAVHQCARFSHDPKMSHEQAVIRIVKYLIGTPDEGIIFTPNKTRMAIDCYVDADFAGLWKTECHADPISVYSRTGFVLMFAGVPLLWCSKLQTEIALSTTESEYMALSHSMREVIPCRGLIKELGAFFKLPSAVDASHSTVFEDNRGCEELAKCPKMNPRTKHIGIKYHHFRSHVIKKAIVVKPIGTDFQLADIFTKPLPESKFTTLRKGLCGW